MSDTSRAKCSTCGAPLFAAELARGLCIHCADEANRRAGTNSLQGYRGSPNEDGEIWCNMCRCYHDHGECF